MNLEQHFLGLPEDAIRDALSMFHPTEFVDGRVLSHEGEVQNTLLFLHEGEVVVEIGGQEVTRLHGPELLGEIALFTNAARTATLRAVGLVQVLVLRRMDYEQLRLILNPVAWRLEHIAAKGLAGRVHQTCSEVAKLGHSDLVIHTSRSSVSVGQPLPASASRLAEKLSKLPEFEDARPESLKRLAEDMRALSFGPGTALTIADEMPLDVSVLISGDMDLTVYTSQSKGFPIMSLGPGAVVGQTARIRNLAPVAAAMITEPATVLQMKANRFDVHYHAENHVGSTLRVACIRAMAEQLAHANAAMAMITLLGKHE